MNDFVESIKSAATDTEAAEILFQAIRSLEAPEEAVEFFNQAVDASPSHYLPKYWHILGTVSPVATDLVRKEWVGIDSAVADAGSCPE